MEGVPVDRRRRPHRGHYTLRDGPGTELTIRHAGEEVTLNTESPSAIAVRHRKPLLPPPPQPPGREPVHRRGLIG